MNGVHAASFRIAELLEGAGIPYAFMGGVATQSLALPTATYDVDLTLREEDATRALSVLAAAGFEIPPEHAKVFRDTLDGMAKLRVLQRTAERPIEIDVSLVTTPFQQASFERRQRATLRGRENWVFTPEDLILYKLMAWRPKDRAAIQNLLIANPACDRAYLQAWADRLGASLEEADRFWA